MVLGHHTVFDPTRTLTRDEGRLRRQFLVGWRTITAGVVGADCAFLGALECGILDTIAPCLKAIGFAGG